MALSRWFPPQTDLPPRRALVAAAFALVALALAGLAGRWAAGGAAALFLVASMGAAAVLLFIAPTSPMSTPWAFVGGHLLSAFIGVTTQLLVPETVIAAPVAVTAAIVAMYLLRCLHPPGGACALLAVVGGEPVHALGYGYVLFPVAVNVTAVLAVYGLYRLVMGRREAETSPTLPEGVTAAPPLPFDESDLAAVLAQADHLVDVSHEELLSIYRRAQAQAHARRLGAGRCRDLAEPPLKVDFDAPLREVWHLFQKEGGLLAVPVVDPSGRVLGVVTLTGFLDAARQWGEGNVQAGIRRLTQPQGRLESECPEVAGQLLVRAPAAPEDAPALPWLETLHQQGHDLPVVDGQGRLRGLITVRRARSA